MTGAHRRETRAHRPDSAGSHRADSRHRQLRRAHLLPVAVAVLVAGGAATIIVPRTQGAADASPAGPTAAMDPAAEAASPAPGRAGQHDEPRDSLPVGNEAPATTPTAPTPNAPGKTTNPIADPSPAARTPAPRPLPEVGSGEFATAGGSTETTGAGALVTYQVEVEREVPLDPAQVAATVDRTLRDPRGWTASGAHALARVNSEGAVRVLLATPETTDHLCAPLDTGGRLSCRNGILVVLNAWRWLNGAAPYAGNLRNYRRYLINHEMGHALGNSHEDCPEPGAIAPVMMQQTKGVGECVINPWPAPS